MAENFNNEPKLLRSDDEMRWKVLSSEYVVKEPWMTVRKDKLELPDGRIKEGYWSLEYPDWINIIAITADGKYIFERQYRHGLDVVEWEIPAGVIEKGEEPLAAAKRELMEETGFGGGDWQPFIETCQNPGTCNNMTHTFLVKGVEHIGKQHFDPAEDLDVYLLTEEEVRGILDRGEIIQSMMAAPLWKYFCLKK